MMHIRLASEQKFLALSVLHSTLVLRAYEPGSDAAKPHRSSCGSRTNTPAKALWLCDMSVQLCGSSVGSLCLSAGADGADNHWQTWISASGVSRAISRIVASFPYPIDGLADKTVRVDQIGD